MGMSLGGYYAPRCAAMDPRFKACVAWGAQWDYHKVWQRRISASRELQLPVPGQHLPWNTGTSTPEEALAALEPFTLDGVAQRITCPFLVCHGEDDQQIPCPDRAAALRGGRFRGQDAPRVHRRRGRRTALPVGQPLGCQSSHLRLDCRSSRRVTAHEPAPAGDRALPTGWHRACCGHCEGSQKSIQSPRAPPREVAPFPVPFCGALLVSAAQG